MSPIWLRWGTLLLSLLAYSTVVHAIGQASCVTFKNAASTFPIVSNRTATPVLLSSDEWPGVQRAAQDFAADIQRVTGIKPSLSNVTTSSFSSNAKKSSSAIIIGTLGRSSLIDQIVKNAKLDVSSVQGQWEAFIAQEVKDPLPGVQSAYVIIGADKRGTIFALYDHSEQFGMCTSNSVLFLRVDEDYARCFPLVLVCTRDNEGPHNAFTNSL